MVFNPNLSVISFTVITPISYLFAKTNKQASLNSSSVNILDNSSLANSILSLSAESTTKTNPIFYKNNYNYYHQNNFTGGYAWYMNNK